MALIGGLAAGEFAKTRREAAATANLVRPQSAPVATMPQPAPHPAPHVTRLASFNGQSPTPDVRHLANWIVDAGDHEGKSFVVVDKKDARVWLFDPDGALVAQTPALLGAAAGDDAVPGIGEKPLAQVLPQEKTTPAGRYVAEPGVNASGEDIIWVSYDLAVSMHRVRPTVKAERRLQRLASATPRDNRISFGCINLPPAFYEQVLRPAVLRTGAIVYVLPETRSAHRQFGSYDVPDPDEALALAPPPRVKKTRSSASTHPWSVTTPAARPAVASIRAQPRSPASLRGREDGDANGMEKQDRRTGLRMGDRRCGPGGTAGAAGCPLRARAPVGGSARHGAVGAAVPGRGGQAVPGGRQEGGASLRF
ncbi:hypothetical protein [Ramlibacter pinisoli]|uniref:hypothetical protein n=1 Tax=Ramlibacter pinisoli TaxID=2682844 RepID=UPI0018DFDAAA|nr:hypothetical protein [Ramlibacter pinisoli]